MCFFTCPVVLPVLVGVVTWDPSPPLAGEAVRAASSTHSHRVTLYGAREVSYVVWPPSLASSPCTE